MKDVICKKPSNNNRPVRSPFLFLVFIIIVMRIRVTLFIYLFIILFIFIFLISFVQNNCHSSWVATKIQNTVE